MTIKKLFFTYLLLALVALPTIATAASAPQQMVENTANQLISALKKNPSKIKNNPGYVQSLVINIVLPHVNQEKMARSVVSRSAWEKASSAQRQAFTAAFRNLVIKTYSAAFSEYTNESIQFKPMRGAGGRDVEVQSILVRSNKPSIPISYRVEAVDSKWKIYDFSVSGVSMVQSFRSQLMGLSQNGLEPVISRLQQHNSRKR